MWWICPFSFSSQEDSVMDVYQIVTDKIISLLEKGTIPLRKPWTTSKGIPRNLVSNKEYRGVNIFLLGCQDFGSPYWLSYKQVVAKNGSVRKGEKASLVVFYQISHHPNGGSRDMMPEAVTVAEEKSSRQRPSFILRYYNVFNLEQCEGITPPSVDVPVCQFTPIEKAEQIVTGMIDSPEIRYGGSKASYSPVKDIIRMPCGDMFEKREEFYSVLFHELGHSSGHQSRLARKEVMECNEFGSEDYSTEELCAELSASMLCAVAGISNETIEMNASYIQNWLSVFRTNKRMLVVAAGKAQKAADYILNRNNDKSGDET